VKHCTPYFRVGLTVVLSLFLLSVDGAGQASVSVNENLETNFLYVDASKGSDSNRGTQQLPLQTIGAAAGLAVYANHQNIGTRITINPGVYRESIAMIRIAGDTSMPITFQAAQSGTVFVSGAVQYTGWRTDGNNSAVYLNSWPNQWGLCPPLSGGGRWSGPVPLQQDIVLRREMIFVNGIPLTQVLTSGQMQPGTFYVDETAALIYVWPAAGTNMDTADLEVPTLPSLFSLEGKSNIVARGLTFEYANSCRENAAVSVGGESNNILFDTDNFLWNNATGFYVGNPGTSNFTVKNSVASHNGQDGFSSGESLYGLYTNITSNYNNWRGAQGAYYAWDSAGGHFFAAHNDTVSQYVSAYNQSHGVHWDTDVANVQVSSVISAGNLLNGVFFEVVEGPNSVSNSYICNNNQGTHDGSTFFGGLDLRNAEQITMAGSKLYNNGVSQINIQGAAGGITTYNWQTSQDFTAITQQFTNTNNVLEGVSSRQQVFHDSYLGGSDWTDFQTTLISSSNTWWNQSNSNAFTVPSPKSGKIDSFSSWQSLTVQDASSHWKTPASNAFNECDIPVDAPDYWIIADSASHTIANGTATFTVGLVPLGTFTGSAKLTFDGVTEVPRLSAKLSSSSTTIPGSASLIVTSAGAASGTYPITIVANSGGTTHTMTASLIVP
jgi:hypothetical protein